VVSSSHCLEKVLHLSGRVTRPVGKAQDRTFRCLEKVLYLGRVRYIEGFPKWSTSREALNVPLGGSPEHFVGFIPLLASMAMPKIVSDLTKIICPTSTRSQTYGGIITFVGDKLDSMSYSIQQIV
jgi:hypothetical protein